MLQFADIAQCVLSHEYTHLFTERVNHSNPCLQLTLQDHLALTAGKKKVQK